VTAAVKLPMAGPRAPTPPFDLEALRRDFPALAQEVHGRPLVYLDNAASSQTPRPVVEALVLAYERDRSNIHRGVHLLSQRATEAYEASRETVARFLNAPSDGEVIFTRGTTEALNLCAFSLGELCVSAGDEVLITGLEHHSNIVPWQMLCQRKGAKLVVVPIDDHGQVPLADFERLLSPRTKVAAFAHVSNALGTVNPVAKMAALAKARGAVVVVDGAQAVPHLPVDVQALGCDLYAFSAHKVFGPTGAGVLWGHRALLERMPPWQGGGDMILSVSFEKTTYAEVPSKFEAGTPPIAGVIGLGAALEYMERVGRAEIASWEHDLLVYAEEVLGGLPGLRIIGTAKEKASVVSFELEDIHPHDIGTILDREGIAIRTGHHCAQPVMERFGVPATARASFAFYNTPDEVLALARGLTRCIEVLR
jgi:cysteine desulfurase / selenocysteine lyase